MVTLQRFTSRERSHSFPDRETTATFSLLSLCLVRRLSCKPNAWISFTDSKNVVVLNLVRSLFPPQKRHPSDTSDARRRVPLFTAFLTFHISRNNTSIRPPGFILPTLTEILFDSCCCPLGKLLSLSQVLGCPVVAPYLSNFARELTHPSPLIGLNSS
jgi:hypothetical protein